MEHASRAPPGQISAGWIFWSWRTGNDVKMWSYWSGLHQGYIPSNISDERLLKHRPNKHGCVSGAAIVKSSLLLPALMVIASISGCVQSTFFWRSFSWTCGRKWQYWCFEAYIQLQICVQALPLQPANLSYWAPHAVFLFPLVQEAWRQGYRFFPRLRCSAYWSCEIIPPFQRPCTCSKLARHTNLTRFYYSESDVQYKRADAAMIELPSDKASLRVSHISAYYGAMADDIHKTQDRSHHSRGSPLLSPIRQ